MAQDNLGGMYANGTGVPQDDAEAAKWYKLAAEQGYATGQVHIGLMYFNGRGHRQLCASVECASSLVARKVTRASKCHNRLLSPHRARMALRTRTVVACASQQQRVHLSATPCSIHACTA